MFECPIYRQPEKPADAIDESMSDKDIGEDARDDLPYEIEYMRGSSMQPKISDCNIQIQCFKDKDDENYRENEESVEKKRCKTENEEIDEDDRLLQENKVLLNKLKALNGMEVAEEKLNRSVEGKANDQQQLYFKLAYFVPVINDVLLHNGLVKTNSSLKANIFWNCKMKDMEAFSKIGSHQKVNHFPASLQLGRKDCLNKNVFHMQSKFPKDFNFLPRTYILPQEEPVLLEVETVKLALSAEEISVELLHREAES